MNVNTAMTNSMKINEGTIYDNFPWIFLNGDGQGELFFNWMVCHFQTFLVKFYNYVIEYVCVPLDNINAESGIHTKN